MQRGKEGLLTAGVEKNYTMCTEGGMWKSTYYVLQITYDPIYGGPRHGVVVLSMRGRWRSIDDAYLKR